MKQIFVALMIVLGLASLCLAEKEFQAIGQFSFCPGDEYTLSGESTLIVRISNFPFALGATWDLVSVPEYQVLNVGLAPLGFWLEEDNVVWTMGPGVLDGAVGPFITAAWWSDDLLVSGSLIWDPVGHIDLKYLVELDMDDHVKANLRGQFLTTWQASLVSLEGGGKFQFCDTLPSAIFEAGLMSAALIRCTCPDDPYIEAGFKIGAGYLFDFGLSLKLCGYFTAPLTRNLPPSWGIEVAVSFVALSDSYEEGGP